MSSMADNPVPPTSFAVTPFTTGSTTSAATATSTSTPSPASSNATAATNSATQQARAASRRPPRKSTLTQQQKNHKRQRATQDQLVTLELEFNKNPTPTAATRERIASDINMTERSVQIWFQNRRAKIKMIAKKGLETGEDCDAVPDSMRQYLALHLDPTKSHTRNNMFSRPTGYAVAGPASSGKIMISHFSCRSLRIGTWRRVGQSTMDLVVFYSPDKSCMTYYINNDSAGYKVEYPFSAIKNIVLESGDPINPADGNSPKTGGLVIELNRPPSFFMDPPNSGGFYQCGDFTEDQQATKCMVHHLGGHPKVLSVQLAKLISLESFRNRHAQFDFSGYAASAPVSPQLIHRPASQPNQPTAPPSGMYQDQQFLHPARGHKRQRSRSVPAPVDFAGLHAPMPTFQLQQQHNQLQQQQQQQQQHNQPQQPQPQHQSVSGQFQPSPNVFAPVPQARHALNATPNADLHVDTSNQYNLEFRPYPMSAATTASSSEFASPSFFASTAPQDQNQLANMGHSSSSYNVPFLSPSPMADQASMMAPSASPLSQISHQTEPMIANQSPPLSSTQHTSAEDMFSMPADQAVSMPDDGLMLSEMYSKQNLNMSMPSPGMEDPSPYGLALHDLPDNHSPANSADYHGLLPFETLDPSTLATES